jgi:penicillin amidase
MRILLRWLRRGLLGLGLLLLLAAGAVAGLLWWSLPPATGRIALPTLSRPVAVGFDAHGIPRIRAEAERDAHVALGFLHARDRLFQMEAMRRGATGRLAEIGGAAALRLDRMVRVLGLERRAAEDLAALDPATREALAAYAEGVNAWIALRGRFAAPEFVLLGAPEPWRAQDSLLWAKVMGLWLSANWRTELERARLAATLPPARLAEIWPADGSAGRPDLAEAAARSAALDQGGHLGRLLAALPRFPGDAPLPDSASNAWAVAGARSASGAPLLATDPHLGFGAPILWYLVRIELPGRVLVGATAPGVPGIVIGRNERIAWGFTTTHSDTQDVFVERLAGPDAYETPDGPRPFLVREEVIRVRGADPVVLRVRETRHGPVVSDLDGMGAPPEGHVLAVAMANLAPRDTAAAGLLALNRAGSVAEAREAARLITSPPQNLMVADAAGRIAMFLTGRTPVRRSGDGRLPVPGWDGAADWTGFVPFDAMPHAEDPPGGLLANANNRVVPPESSVFLGEDWYGDWRFRRIGELAAARPRHDAAGFLAMQADAVSLFARETLPVLRALPPQEGTAAAALALLGAWDGEVAPGLPQPLLFNAWWREFGRAALTEGGVPPGAWEPSPEFVRFVLRPEGAHWCGPAGCRALAAAAWARSVAALAQRFGPDPATWRWGQAHVARFEHPLLRFVPVIGPLVRLEAATPGDGETLNRGGLRGGDFAHVHGAGFRGVFDLAAPDGALAVIAGGQSGHPLSRHWGDLLPLWVRGEAVRPGAEAGPGLTLAP